MLSDLLNNWIMFRLMSKENCLFAWLEKQNRFEKKKFSLLFYEAIFHKRYGAFNENNEKQTRRRLGKTHNKLEEKKERKKKTANAPSPRQSNETLLWQYVLITESCARTETQQKFLYFIFQANCQEYKTALMFSHDFWESKSEQEKKHSRATDKNIQRANVAQLLNVFVYIRSSTFHLIRCREFPNQQESGKT